MVLSDHSIIDHKHEQSKMGILDGAEIYEY